ncbi:hypothetical protein FISHEDRAFT_73143 [Fistulina hepatica ATCC 64428]|uniref:Uncharacterized protein n=1 Tax=Fistulina hepatica ATCC 64428 TaxID=1128425 RepID=A0A0D7ADH8_9AGAR|nr:hypothetical protein FISHEDRAFT_73143 [Fistulina hepatica ATCC 64428]
MAFIPTDVFFPSLLQYTNSQLRDMEDFKVLPAVLELAATISSYNHLRTRRTVAARQLVRLLALHPSFAQGPVAVELVARLRQEVRNAQLVDVSWAAWAGPLLGDDTPAAPVVPSIAFPQTTVSTAAEPVPDVPISISGTSAEEEVIRARTASPHATSLADLATVAASLADPIVVPAIAKDGSAKDNSSSSRETSSPASHASDSEESKDSLIGLLSYHRIEILRIWAVIQNRNLRLNHRRRTLRSAAALIDLEHPDDRYEVMPVADRCALLDLVEPFIVKLWNNGWESWADRFWPGIINRIQVANESREPEDMRQRAHDWLRRHWSEARDLNLAVEERHRVVRDSTIIFMDPDAGYLVLSDTEWRALLDEVEGAVRQLWDDAWGSWAIAYWPNSTPDLRDSPVASTALRSSPQSPALPQTTSDDLDADPDYEEPDRKGKRRAKRSATPLFFPSSPHALSPEFVSPDEASAIRTPPLKLRLHLQAPTASSAPAVGQATAGLATTPVDVPTREPSLAVGPPRLIICLPARAAAPAAQPTPTPAPVPVATTSDDLPSHWIHREGYPATLPECRVVPLHETSPVCPLPPSVWLTGSLLNDPVRYNPEFVDMVERELAEEDRQQVALGSRSRGPTRPRAVAEARRRLHRPRCPDGPSRHYHYIPSGYGDETDASESEWPEDLEMSGNTREVKKAHKIHISIKRCYACRRDGILCTYVRERQPCDYCQFLHQKCSRVHKNPVDIAGAPAGNQDLSDLVRWRDIASHLGFRGGLPTAKFKSFLKQHKPAEQPGKKRAVKHRRVTSEAPAPVAGPSGHQDRHEEFVPYQAPLAEPEAGPSTFIAPVSPIAPVEVVAPVKDAMEVDSVPIDEAPLPGPLRLISRGTSPFSGTDVMLRYPSLDTIKVPRQFRVAGAHGDLPPLDLRDPVVGQAYNDYVEATRNFCLTYASVHAIEQEYPQFASTQRLSNGPVYGFADPFDAVAHMRRLWLMAQARATEMRQRWQEDPELNWPSPSPEL